MMARQCEMVIVNVLIEERKYMMFVGIGRKF